MWRVRIRSSITSSGSWTGTSTTGWATPRFSRSTSSRTPPRIPPPRGAPPRAPAPPPRPPPVGEGPPADEGAQGPREPPHGGRRGGRGPRHGTADLRGLERGPGRRAPGHGRVPARLPGPAVARGPRDCLRGPGGLGPRVRGRRHRPRRAARARRPRGEPAAGARDPESEPPGPPPEAARGRVARRLLGPRRAAGRADDRAREEGLGPPGLQRVRARPPPRAPP